MSTCTPGGGCCENAVVEPISAANDAPANIPGLFTDMFNRFLRAPPGLPIEMGLIVAGRISLGPEQAA
jgi:hypothetical protein